MKMDNFIAYVAFGSNVRPQKKTIEKALELLSICHQVKIQKISSLYLTTPVGGPPQNDFLNGVVEIATSLSVVDLFSRLLEIEKKCGRVRRIKWGPRTLDLDLLAYNNKVRQSKKLVIPHPRYHLRRFVLVPFNEIAPRYRHPLLMKSNGVLLRQLTAPDQRVTMIGQWKKSRYVLFKKEKK